MRQQRLKIRTDDRMYPVRIDIAGRLQDKSPLMQARMGDDQPIGPENAVIEKQYVEIEDSWTEPNAAFLAACHPLNVLKRIEQAERIEIGFDTGHTVYEPILIENMHGFRPVASRDYAG